MAVNLLDVNVLIALAWDKHKHHLDAHRWFVANSSSQFATCPMTQCGFVRISSNPQFLAAPPSMSQIFVWLDDFVSQPAHVFWPDDANVGASSHFPRSQLRGHLQITDAYLFALAVQNGGKLATFDRGVMALPRNEAEEAAIILVPT